MVTSVAVFFFLVAVGAGVQNWRLAGRLSYSKGMAVWYFVMALLIAVLYFFVRR